MKEEMKQTEFIIESSFRSRSHRIIIIGAMIGAAYFMGFLAYHSIFPADPAGHWLLRVINEHYAATIGTPLSALTAFCIVVLLQIMNQGPIEFEALGFKFKGASGPVVLWIFCFLAVVAGFSLLWSR